MASTTVPGAITLAFPPFEGGGHNSGRNGTREIHGSHMSLAHDLLEFVMGDSQHQVIPHDAAAHSPVAEKRQTAASFGGAWGALRDFRAVRTQAAEAMEIDASGWRFSEGRA
jgi:hypothetical protein